MAHDI
jgi:hypothetical protein